MLPPTELKRLLDQKYEQFNQPDFIAADPICIPHRFTQKQDIEISGFFAAILAWGQRKTIIAKCTELLQRMDGAPADFIQNHQDADLKQLLGFKHRTFNDTDLLYLVYFLRQFYAQHASLELAFVGGGAIKIAQQKDRLIHFHQLVFALPEAPVRIRKHIATPARKSACKRLNMFLRWMVRQDNHGVDFGLWQHMRPADLICPCDVHVDRVARRLGLITRPQTDWQTAVELTEKLKQFDPIDPVKYDFALFGLGVAAKIVS